MTDPYKILGVSRDASDDEIKRVYRELVKKYHPDNYQDSPLADLAQQKMAEINNAYDEIVKQRKAKAQGGSYGETPYGYGSYNQSYNQGYNQGYNYGSYQSYGSGKFDDIRRLINMGRILEAQEVLEGISPDQRDAEWYFLKGYVLYSRGFLEDAYPYFQKANQMDPGNREYADMFARINASRQNGYVHSSYNNCGSCNPCGICATMACLNCCGCTPGWFCCI